MASPLYNLVISWLPNSTDNDYKELQNVLKTKYATQFNIQTFLKIHDSINYIHSIKNSSLPLIVITKLGTTDETSGELLIKEIRRFDQRPFIILHSHKTCADPNLRWSLSELGANMITEYVSHIDNVLQKFLLLSSKGSPKNTYTCPFCKMSGLSFDQIYIHVPLYHTNEKELSAKCEICGQATRNFVVHLHEDHNTNGQSDSVALPLYAYALVVCRRKSDNRFLVVQESGSVGFWLPGGRVEAKEQLDKAAERETLEEAGVKIRITGILRIEFVPRSNINRLRIIFYAEPFDENDCQPKTIPDYESYGAMWLSYEQVLQCSFNRQLRGSEPLIWFKYVTQNGVIHPLSVLSNTE